MGGFGSGVLEAFHREGWSTENVRCHGIPDQFVEHSPAAIQRANLKLDAPGVVETVLTFFPDLAQVSAPGAEKRPADAPKENLLETVTW